MKIDSSLARVHFFKAMIEKADGDYDAAIKSLQTVVSKYPRDRVAQNQLARIQFLDRKYAEAIETLKKVNDIDPEDIQMHYTAMLAYRGLGNTAEAERSQKLFMRFKAEESSQAITAQRRLLNPEENNERQMIHDHESVPLPKRPSASKTVITDQRKPAASRTGGDQ
jgi:tetratricopeptide (TPR) repeat protein